jgi:hypothetical protein
MPRPKNQLETVSITLSTTRPVVDYLERLVESGLYGKNPAEAAERLVALGIEDLIRRDLLARRPSARSRRT